MKYDYSKMIKSGNAIARNLDKKAFEDWNNGVITTKECFEAFLSNNGRKSKNYVYDEEDFIKWLNSLGYRRREDI